MEDAIKLLKKAPLFSNIADEDRLSLHKEDIEAVIPHRSPFLLVEQIVALNLKDLLIGGESFISSRDPIFQGHFPNKPLYPGVLQLEMMGQLGLCLSYFVFNETKCIDSENQPFTAMVTKLHHATFNAPVFPNRKLAIYAKILDYDTLSGMIAGQIYCQNQLCSYCIMEAYFDE